jgi:hypothetical protein
MESDIRRNRARCRLARDDVDGAIQDVELALPAARRAGDPQAVFPALVTAAWIYAEAARHDDAKPLAREAISGAPPTWSLGDLAWFAVELDCVDELRERIEHRAIRTKWTDAAGAVLRGDLVGAADIFFEIGDRVTEAFARLRAAEQLVAEGRRAEADAQLHESLAFWRSVRASRYVREGEALLAAVS